RAMRAPTACACVRRWYHAHGGLRADVGIGPYGPARLPLRATCPDGSALRPVVPTIFCQSGGVSMLELRHLSKKYVTTRALQDVSFSLGPGEFVGLFGENGAGKTTLMKCVLGLLGHQGEITLDGAAVTRKNIA